MKRERAIHFTLISLSALSARLLLARYMPLDFDESWYLANSSLVSDGLVPFKDFFGRSPLLLYLMGAVVQLFGSDIFFGRLVSVVSTSLTAGLLFLISRRLFSKRVAITAGLLYALSPFTLRYGYLAVTEPLAQLLVVLSIYLILCAVEKKGFFLYVLSGVVLSMAVLARRSSAIYAIGLPLLILLLKGFGEESKKIRGRALGAAMMRTIAFIVGFFAAFIFALLFLLTPGNRGMIVSMYDMTELWRYAGTESTIVWNVKELTYQMPYLIIFSAICLSTWARRALGRFYHNMIMAISCTIAIFLLDAALSLDGLEGIVSQTFIGFIASSIYTLLIIGMIALLFRPWDVLSEYRNRTRDSISMLLPLCLPVGAAFVVPGAVMTDQLLQSFLDIYLLSIVALILLVAGARYLKRLDKGTKKLYRGCVLILFVIYSTSSILPIISHRTFLSFAAAVLVSALFILMKVFLTSRVPRFADFTFQLGNMRHLYSSTLLAYCAVLIPWTYILQYHVTGIGWNDALYRAWILLMAGLAAYVLGFNARTGTGEMADAANPLPRHSLHAAVPVFMAAVPFLFYFLRSWWMPIYFFEMAPGMVILTALVVASTGRKGEGTIRSAERRDTGKDPRPCGWTGWLKKGKDGRVILTLLLAIALLFPACMYVADPYNIYLGNRDQHPTPGDLRQAASIIRDNTDEADEIFAWPVYAFQSDRRMIFNITHPLLYGEFSGPDEAGLAHFGYPTVREIIEYMDSNDIRLVVVDVNIEEVFFTGRDHFREYIYTHYNIAWERGSVRILVRNGQ